MNYPNFKVELKKMSANKKLTHYVSEIDQFLQTFDQTHPELAQSQEQERAKYRRIYLLRDDALSTDPTSKLWKDF
jgi:hypothetical protein